MEKWLEEWRRRYQTLKSAIENNQYNEKLYTELANECEQLLQTWMEMEDNLDDLKDLKEENSEPNVTEIKQMKTEGITYFDLEMFPKAIEVLKQELNEIDESLEASHHLFIGFANLYEANLDLSKESFLYVAHSSESTIEKHFAYFGLGCLYGRLRQYDEAISFFEKAEQYFTNPDLLYNMGIAYLLLNKGSLAIPFFKKALEHNDEDGESYYFLGLSYLRSGNETKAFESWYASLQLIEHRELLVSIAYEFEQMGYFSTAIHCYRRLQALGHNESWVEHGIAWNYGLLNEKKRSIELFETLLAKDPEEVNIWISYLWLLAKWNELDLYHYWMSKATDQIKAHPLIKKTKDQLLI